MKLMLFTSIFLSVLIFSLVSAGAMDINDLDRVSIMMPKSEVLSIAGRPDDIGDIGHGLKVDIYRVPAIAPMMGTGFIYDDKGILMGQAFIFSGSVGKTAAEHIRESGFSPVEQKGNSYRLLGKDDDTGRPIMAYIVEEGGLTTVFTFEKSFYDRNVKPEK